MALVDSISSMESGFVTRRRSKNGIKYQSNQVKLQHVDRSMFDDDDQYLKGLGWLRPVEIR
jgi:hypothetical protein